MLPEISEDDYQYLAWLYRRVTYAYAIKEIYNHAAIEIAKIVEPKWTRAGNVPPVFGTVAILHVHECLAPSKKDAFAARYCIHTLLHRYTKAHRVASKG